LLTHVIMLDPLVVAYVQFVTMPIEINKILSHEPNICAAIYHSPIGMNCTKHYGCDSLTFLMHWV